MIKRTSVSTGARGNSGNENSYLERARYYDVIRNTFSKEFLKSRTMVISLKINLEEAIILNELMKIHGTGNKSYVIREALKTYYKLLQGVKDENINGP